MSRVTIVENKYTSIYFDLDLNLYEQYWYSATEDMEDEDYKEIQTQMINFFKEHKEYIIHNYLLDNREFLFSMSPEMQEWQAKYVMEFLAENMHTGSESIKTAVITSGDFISQLSIEQTMEENEVSENAAKYFETEQEAREWLFDI